MSKRLWSHFNLIALCAFVISTTARAQSLWKEESSRSMTADKRATAVGDILTGRNIVLPQEALKLRAMLDRHAGPR